MKLTQWLRRVRSGLLVVLCGLMLAGTGCDNEDTTSTVTPTKFQLERELEFYSSVDYFAWDTTLRQAVVTIHIKDFSHGDATIKVYDARGKQIFARRLYTNNYVYYAGDNEYITSGVTELGEPGVWRVELAYSEFSGEVNLVMQ